MFDDIKLQVENLLLPVIAQSGLELVELNLTQNGAAYTIEVLADHPQGGITLQECVKLNKKIVEVLDAFELLAEGYELVVASPGLDRLLKGQKDFGRLVGRRVKVLLTEKIEGQREYSGVIKAAGDDAVVIVFNKKQEVKVPYAKILKAVLVI